ncbi:MAG TPA: type II CAAX endopeptidase family protein [Anaerolineae bacterium]|nr:type II CAAX endopeptidase family protein [Anaerolineae bacterium]
MTRLLSSQNHLFELARRGQRLPHIALAIGLSLVIIIAAQIIGGIPASLIIIALSTLDGQLDFSDLSSEQPQLNVDALMPDTALEQAILLIFAFAPIFLMLWGWLALFEKRPYWTLGLELAGAWWKYLRGILVGLVMFSASVGLLGLLGYTAVESGTSQPQGVTALGGVLLVLFGWVVQGAGEEILTRGWLLQVIGARYRPVWGILLSTLLFALFHLCNPNVSLVAMLNLALFGLFAALYTLYEGGLWGIFSIHSVWNWAQGNLFGFEVSGMPPAGGSLFNLMETGPDLITGGPFGPEGGLAVTTVLVISCLLVWGASLRQRP